LAAITLALRRFRDGRVAVMGLAGLVLVTAVCAAAAPRLLDRLADDALRGEVTAASPFQRNVQLIQERRYDADENGDDPLARVAQTGVKLEEEIPAAVRALFRDRSYIVEGIRWAVIEETTDPGFVRLRIQEAAEEHVRYVEGRPPTDATREMTVTEPTLEEDITFEVVEVALSQEALERIGLAVGDTWMLRPDEADRLVGRGGGPQPGAVDVVGAFEAIDEDEEYWLDDTALIRPTIRTVGDNDNVDMTALVAPEAYAALLRSTERNHPPYRYTWRFFVDPPRLEAERLAPLVRELRRLEGTFSSTGGAVEGGTMLRTGLLQLIESEQRRWAAAAAVLAVIAIGPAAVGVAALALIGSFVMERRRAALALGRARGATAGQLVSAVAIEGLMISIPPALLAAGLAFVLVPTGPRALTVAGAAAVALITTLLLVLSGGPTALSSPRGPGRTAPQIRRPSPRRLAIELLIVVLAVLGAYLLRERGVRGESSAAELSGSDPFIAAVPALAGLAAGIVAVRLLPVPMLLLSRLAALRRDLVPVLALRRVTRGGTSGSVLIVLMATATIGTFAGATLVHVDRAAEAVSWQEVGAPYRLSSPNGLPGSFDPLDLPGVQAAAGEYEISSVLATRFLQLQLVAIDAPDYATVVAGTPGDPHLPAEMLGDARQPLPAIVSPALTEGAQGVDVGETFQLVVEGYPVEFRVVEVRESFPTMATNQTFVIASRTQIRALRDGEGLRTSTAMYLRAPDDAGPEIERLSRSSANNAAFDSRFERTEAIRTAPILQALVAGVGVAAAIAFVYAALAVSAALALAGAARSVEVAHLRTLGLTRREAFGLVVVEHGPTIAVAFAVGTILGLALFGLLREALGVGALVGTNVDIAVAIDVAQLAVVLAAIVLIVALGMVLGAALQRGAAPVAAIRRGFD
jgi:putative ABC transport system permease protein